MASSNQVEILMVAWNPIFEVIYFAINFIESLVWYKQVIMIDSESMRVI